MDAPSAIFTPSSQINQTRRLADELTVANFPLCLLLDLTGWSRSQVVVV